jgi:hypothetical protein
VEIVKHNIKVGDKWVETDEKAASGVLSKEMVISNVALKLRKEV